MLAVRRTVLPFVVLNEVAIWLSRVIVHQVSPAVKRPFLTMLVAVVVGVEVVAAVSVTVKVSLMVVVSSEYSVLVEATIGSTLV